MQKHQHAKDALQVISSGHRIFIHGGAATPQTLVNALVAESPRLKDVEIMHLHTHGEASYAKPEYADSFKVANIFVGKNMRHLLDYDRVDYIPCFLSETPKLFRSGKRPLDVALIHVSPPDKHGYCSLGVSVDIAEAAVETAKIVIAQVNPKMPRVLGDGFLHKSSIDHFIEVDEPLHELIADPISEEEKQIGENAASIIEDGATIQVGIGAIPNAVLNSLRNHKHLGLHTEMWSDGALDLIELGIIDNSMKKIHPGQTVSSFLLGTQKLYEFVHDNPSVIQLDIAYVNGLNVITQNPKVTAINSAVEIDLTGQVCADSIGSRIISGVGGQMDFMRGSALSEDGKPIIALTSRTKRGIPRIVPQLRVGAGVVTTRSHVHYIITEYGIVDLYGKTLRERAEALINLAHPDDRKNLDKRWHEIMKRYP